VSRAVSDIGEATLGGAGYIARAERPAYIAFLRGLLVDLPAPDALLSRLTLAQLAALRSAWQAQDPDNAGCWRVSRDDAALLRPMGLVEVPGCYLTGFGIQALRLLRRLEQ